MCMYAHLWWLHDIWLYGIRKLLRPACEYAKLLVFVYLSGKKATEREGESEKNYIKKAPPFMITYNYELKYNHMYVCKEI